jgi:chorismate synthase
MALRFLTAGESHGPAMTAILDGIPSGLILNKSIIDQELSRRKKGFGSSGRMKIENDIVSILSGVMGGETTGAPITLLINNIDHENWRGVEIPAFTMPRPGHADLVGAVKYSYRDLRPSLERASARETSMRVAVGAVCKQFLDQFGIIVGGYVSAIGEIQAQITGGDYQYLFAAAEDNSVRCPDPIAADRIKARIRETACNKDTLGGVIEIVALNVPIGLSSFSQWDQRLEARLAKAVLSVQAIKGIEIGDAFGIARIPGTKAHDAISLSEDISESGGNLTRPTNRAGGIEGGISNGEPIVIRAAMKPISSLLTPQPTVDLALGKNTSTMYERSDFCPVPRTVPILEAMVAIVLTDALIEKLGGDSMAEMKPRFNSLCKARLEDLPMDNQSRVWWE